MRPVTYRTEFYIAKERTDPDIVWFSKNPNRLYRFRKAQPADPVTGKGYCYVLAHQVAHGLVLLLGISANFDLEKENVRDLTEDSTLQQLGFFMEGEQYLDQEDTLFEIALKAGLVPNVAGLRQLP